MLATLDELKGRLGGGSNTDDDLIVLLGACSAKILDLCRYVEANTSPTPLVETLMNVQQGREFEVGKRPVVDDATVVVEGRGHGAAFQTLAHDLLDPAEGKLMILGSADWWPPNYVEERRPRFRRWREPVWPVVKVTYNVVGVGDEQTAPDVLREATLELATYWLSATQAGAVTKVQIGQLMQEFSSHPLPMPVRSILGSRYRGAGAKLCS